MRQFIISVGGEKFEVDVVEVSKTSNTNSTKGYNSAANESKKFLPEVTSKEVDLKVQSNPNAVAINSPMPGSIVRIFVNPGEIVSKGQKLFILEAMKMENEIGAPLAGKVSAVKVNVGDTVSEGQHVMNLN